jgi:hypothetical protein
MAVITQQDGSTVQTWDTAAGVYTLTVDGVITEQRPFNDQENATAAAMALGTVQQTNRATLLAQVRTALAVDQAYLANVAAGTATQAQVVAQVATLTRQLMGFGRLLAGGDFLDIVDSP